MPRTPKITRFGCEDVRGAHVTWAVGGRTYLGEVRNIIRREHNGSWILECRHMDGSRAPDVLAACVTLLERTYSNMEAD